MSFMQTRMTMSTVRELDFTGATALSLFYQGDSSSPLGFSVYRATVKPGFDDVAVDWGDGTVQRLVPDPESREVRLSHSYASRLPVTVRIQDRLDVLEFSHAEPGSVDEYSIGISSVHDSARALSGVLSLGSNVSSRKLSSGLFARTSISSYPSPYSAPPLSSKNQSAPCVPFGCFYDCPRLSSLGGIPSGLVAVDAYAFAHCTSLVSVSGLSGSPGLMHIGFMAFGRCTSLPSLDGISSTLNPTPSTLFGGNLGLSDLKAEMLPNPPSDENLMRIYRMNLFMFPVAPFAFYGCTSLTSLGGLELAMSQKVPMGAFQGCSSLSEVPDSIRNAYFADREYRNDNVGGKNYNRVAYGLAPNNALTTGGSYQYYISCGVEFRGDPVLGKTTIDGAFSGTAVTEFIGLDSVYDTYSSTKYRSAFGSHEFGDCPNVTSMTFPRQVSYLNFRGDTFSGCTNLKDVSFPNLTREQVQQSVWNVTGPNYGGYNSSSYPFGLPTGCVIHCSDGDITVA